MTHQTPNETPNEIRGYNVTHTTLYEYEHPVSFARHQLHLSPRPLPWQNCPQHTVTITPTPDFREETLDAFGNVVQRIIIEHPHDSLTVHAETRALIAPRPKVPDTSPAWEDVRASLSYRVARCLQDDTLEASRYAFESPIIRIKRDFAAWAADCFSAGTPIHHGAQSLMHKLYTSLTFDPDATHTGTTVVEVLKNMRGVCQDYAHLMIACLRSLGLAARYMSGYILTHPAPGKPRLIGADASHAWVAVYCGDSQWLELDPTNGMLADQEHITIGWGRDFSDISPLRGVIVGGGTHEPDIAVTVLPDGEHAVG